MYRLIDDSQQTLARLSFEPYDFRLTKAGENAPVDLEQLLGPVVRATSTDAEPPGSVPDGATETMHEEQVTARPKQQQRLVADAIADAEMPLAIVGDSAQLATRYGEGDIVETPDGIGVIAAVINEVIDDDALADADDVPDRIEASDDSPTYGVVTEQTGQPVRFFKASDLEASEIETDVDPIGAVSEDKAAAAALCEAGSQEAALAWSPPESWRESDTPARLIGLKAFASMGSDFDGCTKEMRGNVATPERFCGGFLDYIFAGYTAWRGDSFLPGD